MPMHPFLCTVPPYTLSNVVEQFIRCVYAYIGSEIRQIDGCFFVIDNYFQDFFFFSPSSALLEGTTFVTFSQNKATGSDYFRQDAFLAFHSAHSYIL